VKILSPLHEATVKLSAEKVATMNEVIPSLDAVHATLTGQDSQGSFSKRLLDQFNQRFPKYQRHYIWSISTLFDPRY
jgi:hypothetical protein